MILKTCNERLQATKGKQVISFFSIPEYEEWKKKNDKGWSIKYYKVGRQESHFN